MLNRWFRTGFPPSRERQGPGSAALIAALLLAVIGAGCGEPESCRLEGASTLVCADGKRWQLDHPPSGCTIHEVEGGERFLICEDGSQYQLPDASGGEDGRNGNDGKDGKDGEDGRDGRDGTDGLDGKNGKDGRDGEDGQDGEDGEDGADGVDGEDGEDGLTTLIRLVDEPAGQACAAGGTWVLAGLDRNRDGVLDPEDEVEETRLICNGLPGEDGEDGGDGAAGETSLIRLEPEPAGARCAFGGTAVHAGRDLDGDGLLDDEEIEQTELICRADPHWIGWALELPEGLVSDGRNLIEARAVLSGVFDPLRKMRWRVLVERREVIEGEDEEGQPTFEEVVTPVEGMSFFFHVPVDPDLEPEPGAGGGPGEDPPDLVDDPDDPLSWTGELVSDERGIFYLEDPPVFTAGQIGLSTWEGARSRLGAEPPGPGEYRFTFSLVDDETLEPISEARSDFLIAEPLESLLLIPEMEEMLPGRRQLVSLNARLGEEVAADTAVRMRYRIAAGAQPLVAQPIYLPGPEGKEFPDHEDPHSWTETIVTDAAGEAWVGDPAGFPAGELQKVVGVGFFLALSFDPGTYRFDAEIVDVDTGAVLLAASQSWTIAHTTPLLEVDVESLGEDRRLLPIQARISTQHPAGDSVRLEFELQTAAGGPVADHAFFFDGGDGRPGEEASDPAAWTASFRTNTAGIATSPAAVPVPELQTFEPTWFFFGLEDPPLGAYTLVVRLRSVESGGVLASGTLDFEVD